MTGAAAPRWPGVRLTRRTGVTALSRASEHLALLSPLLTKTVHGMAADETPGGYSVRAVNRESGSAIKESYAGIAAAIARSAELLRDGYTVEIRSVAPR